jgi:hypothetical protein
MLRKVGGMLIRTATAAANDTWHTIHLQQHFIVDDIVVVTVADGIWRAEHTGSAVCSPFHLLLLAVVHS